MNEWLALGVDMLTGLDWQRPLWLWAMLPGLVLILWQRKQSIDASQWQRFIAPSLLQALRVQQKSPQKLNLSWLAFFTLLCWSVALAGPQWGASESIHRERAPLVISLSLSSEGLSESQQAKNEPVWLSLIKFKTIELLEKNRGTLVAIQVFAGSTHWVLPLTNDTNSLIWYVKHLNPSIMPVEGWQPEKALLQGEEILPKGQGTQLLITPFHPNWSSFITLNPTITHPIDIWLVGDAPQNIEAPVGMRMARIYLPNSALPSLAQHSRSKVAVQKRTQGSAQEGIDLGYYAVYPMAMLCLFWFRRGVLLRW